MSRLTVRGRVTLAAAVVLAVGLVVLTIAINAILEAQLDADASAALHERADAERALLRVRDGRVVVLDAPRDQDLDQQGWVFSGGRALRRAPARPDVQAAAATLAGPGAPRERVVDDRVRLLAEPGFEPPEGKPGATIVVGLSLVPYNDTERIALATTIGLDVLVLLAGALLARAAVGVALRPVADMTDRAADWSVRDLDRRFNLGPPRDEIGALSATLDGMLGRLAASLRHEQRFSAEMAHELRTPLSGVRGEAELALHDPGLSPAARESFDQILRATDRMTAVIDTLLATARRDPGTAAGAANPTDAAEAAADAVRSHAEREAVAIDVIAPEQPWRVGAETDIVAQALQPLLDNAVRHARHAVTLTVGRAGDAATFTVDDDGPGLDGADLDAIFQPGTSSAGSAGLGLPLARRLARVCGGDVVAVRRPEGGRFELRVPVVG